MGWDCVVDVCFDKAYAESEYGNEEVYVIHTQTVNEARLLKDEDVKIQEYRGTEGLLVRFTYEGPGDCVIGLDAAIEKYASGRKYTDFVDSNMDNPSVRIIEISYSEPLIIK